MQIRRRRNLPPVHIDRTAGDPVVYEGGHPCGMFWWDAVDGAYAIQYASGARGIIRGIATEADAIRTLLGR